MNEHIVKQHLIIEALFATYSDVLGNDMEKYKNHVYRILCNFGTELRKYCYTN